MESVIVPYESDIRESILEDPVRIVLEILGRICIEIENLPGIRNDSHGLRPRDRFRATILLYRKKEKDFAITPLRMILGKLAARARLRFAEKKGLLWNIWESACNGTRTATGITLPKYVRSKPKSRTTYFAAWQKWGVRPEVAKKFTRKGQFYMYVPLFKRKGPIGILVVDANIQVKTKVRFSKLVEIVGRNVGYLEACFRDDISINDGGSAVMPN